MSGTKKTTGKHRRHARGDLRRTVRLFRRFMGNRRVYVIGVLLLVLEATTAVVQPYPIAYLIDFLQSVRPNRRELGVPAFLASERPETLLLLTVAIVLIAAVNSAADSLAEVCMARGGRSLGYSIRIAMYSHLQRLPLAYHDRRRTGDVLTRVTGDVLVVEDFVVKSVSNIFGSLMVLVGSFAFLAYQSWNVALVALVVVPLLAVVSTHFSRRIKVASKRQRDREGDLASTAQEMLTSIRLVQSYGRGTVDLHRFSSQTAKSMHASLGAANIQAQFSFVVALVEALSISAVIWLGVWLVDRHAITIGTLVLFVLLLQNMFKPARKVVSEWYQIGKVFASVERIQDLLDREVGVEDLPEAVPAPPLQGRLTFSHVSFAYPVEHEDGSPATGRQPVLDDIDFEVAAGEVVALVGFSGAGKSTIAQLVPRLYEPDKGEVLVDGIPVRQLTLASLRSQVSVVLQETVLLSGTVAENIGYGIADATQADIEAAARMANAHDFIVGLPDGYETQLGERGSTLSGGQRQRIAIARAFIRRAPILILDEPTTGLDRESAETVVSALRNLMHGTTTIVISHDPGLIRGADRVLVISSGRIVESRRQESLLVSSAPSPDLSSGEAAPPAEPALDSAPARVRPADPDSRADGDPRLLAHLEEHLPGLSRALDHGFAAAQIEGTLLDGSVGVEALSADKIWLRADGSCSLRYRVRLAGSPNSAETTVHVLGRVHPDAVLAGTDRDWLASEAIGRRVQLEPPWRVLTSVAPQAALLLSRFPVDPSLPTLAAATEPGVLARLEPFSGLDRLPNVMVVHHPREGACVLRLVTTEISAPDGQASATLYGKVYGDADRGRVVDGLLGALAQKQARFGISFVTRFPRPVLYEPSLRLLLTEALPGEPLVPGLVKSVLGSRSPELAETTTALKAAVRDSGRALATLHSSDVETAPPHSAAQELAGLRAELEIVGRIWPTVACELAAKLYRLIAHVPDAPDMVLSHGDFTPAQVLLTRDGSAVLDLDTMCWADAALDLGRYLAHLELLAVKAGGPPGRHLVENMTDEFIGGYREAAPPSAFGAALENRIAFYMATTLARTALHGCRQLKGRRLELGLSLLDHVHAEWAGR